VPTGSSSASRPLTDTLVTVLRPVTGTVQSLTDARPVGSLVGTLDQVVGALPVVGTVLGDDTLGTVTSPVTGLVDDTLGDVGSIVGGVPGTVGGLPPVIGGTLPGGTDPVVIDPSAPAGGGSGSPLGSATSVVRSAVDPAAARGAQAAASLAASVSARAASADASPATVRTAASTSPSDVQQPQDATFGGRALLVPEGHGTGHGGPTDGAVGVLGGTTAGSSGAAGAVGIVGSTDGQISLAAGSRGTRSDDALPASIAGEHDVAPD